MATIRPFAGIRPRTDLVHNVAALPYDVYNTEEAREVVSGNPMYLLKSERQCIVIFKY